MLEIEKYLLVITNLKFRGAMARFRCGNHNLAIESGRWSNQTRSERTCLFCKNHMNLDVIEDEIHFLLMCPCYVHLRRKLFPVITDTCINHGVLHKFNYIMSNVDTAAAVAEFICCSLKKRERYIFEN